MASTSLRLVLFLVLAAAVVVSCAQLQLSETFYDVTCPQAASIVQQKVNAFVDTDRGLAAALMRLHFHDCFVRGCDGSVLLNSTESMLTEKKALLNKGSLRGFEQIDEIKMELECACPGVVSCADILALVARDATAKLARIFGPYRRRSADEVNGSLPERRENFTQLVASFAKVGLDARDMIILSGGHSIGQVHCGAFFERLYNFQGLNITDPSMDPEFADMLKAQCPQTKPFGFMALDATNGTFDSAYYLDLLTNKGVGRGALERSSGCGICYQSSARSHGLPERVRIGDDQNGRDSCA
ncbi:hypothetical protein Mapa_002435 [Marchantia paleacea]|nr:hypothetical protein Mapa_002435 [Marchantia paleacea]